MGFFTRILQTPDSQVVTSSSSSDLALYQIDGNPDHRAGRVLNLGGALSSPGDFVISPTEPFVAESSVHEPRPGHAELPEPPGETHRRLEMKMSSLRARLLKYRIRSKLLKAQIKKLSSDRHALVGMVREARQDPEFTLGSDSEKLPAKSREDKLPEHRVISSNKPLSGADNAVLKSVANFLDLKARALWRTQACKTALMLLELLDGGEISLAGNEKLAVLVTNVNGTHKVFKDTKSLFTTKVREASRGPRRRL